MEDFEFEYETFQRQALLVEYPDENFDPTAIPTDGMEYLKKVVYERRTVPAIVVKDLDESKKKKNLSGTGKIILVILTKFILHRLRLYSFPISFTERRRMQSTTYF